MYKVASNPINYILNVTLEYKRLAYKKARLSRLL